MRARFGWLGIAVVAVVGFSPARQGVAAQSPAKVAPCAADSNYQRLAFWVGDWDVLDSAGNHYATQRVHAQIDTCAITAEWASGGGNKGLGLLAYDARPGEWKQVYVSNQLPFASGIKLRKSDPSYRGPGVRFIQLIEPAAGELSQSRVTIMPYSGHGAMQLFEDSKDGGKTWTVVFKAEHRRMASH